VRRAAALLRTARSGLKIGRADPAPGLSLSRNVSSSRPLSAHRRSTGASARTPHDRGAGDLAYDGGGSHGHISGTTLRWIEAAASYLKLVDDSRIGRLSPRCLRPQGPEQSRRDRRNEG